MDGVLETREMIMVVPGGTSFLEMVAVPPKVMDNYAPHHQDFKAFCWVKGHNTNSVGNGGA